MRRRLVLIIALAISSAGCGGVEEAEPSMLDLVQPEGGKADGTMKTVSGYVLVRNVDTTLRSSDSPYRHRPSGWVTLYSLFGTNHGQIDLSYYERVGVVHWGTCHEQEMRDPFPNNALGVDNFLCKVVASRPVDEPKKKVGYILVEMETMDGSGVLTGEVSRPYLSIKGELLTATEEMPVFAEASTQSEILLTAGVGTSLTFSRERLISVAAASISDGSRVELRFLPVSYK